MMFDHIKNFLNKNFSKLITLFWIDTKSKFFHYFKKYLPFFLFLLMFRFGALLHYTILAPLWQQIMPLRIVGLLIWSMSFVQLILDIPAWYLLDRFWYVKILKIATFLFIIASLFLIFDLTVAVFVITLVVWWFGRLLFSPWSIAYILAQSPKEHAGKFISLREIFNSVWVVFCTAIIAFILPWPPFMLWLLIAFILMFAWLLLLISPEDNVSVHIEKKIETHDFYIRRQTLDLFAHIRKFSPVSLSLILTTFSSWLFYALIWFIIPLMIVNHQWWAFLGISLGIFDLAVVILWFTIWKLADKYDKNKLVFLWLLIFSLSAILLGFNFGIMFLILWFIATTWDEIANISLRAWLDSLETNHKNDGKVAGAISMASDLWRAIWPLLAGILYTTVWPSRAISIGGIILFITMIIYKILLRRYSHNLPSVIKSYEYKPHNPRHKH